MDRKATAVLILDPQSAGTKLGEFVAKAFKVTVVDGQVNLDFEDVGGSDAGWNIRGLRLRHVLSANALDALMGGT